MLQIEFNRGWLWLGFVDGLFVPHCDKPGILENAKDLLKTSPQIGLIISDCAALKIVDDRYRLITSDASYHNIHAHGIRAYWENGKYLQGKIDDSLEFKPLKDLLSKNINSGIK